MSMYIKVEDFEEFNDINDGAFDLQYSLEIAKETINKLKAENNEDNFVFDSHKWRFMNSNKTYIYFDFRELELILSRKKKIEQNTLLIVIKCWVATNLELYTPKTARDALTSLSSVIKASHTFTESPESLDCLIDKMNGFILSKKYYTSVHALNFIDYFEEIDPKGDYAQVFRKLRDSVPLDKIANVRILPKSKDVLIFHTILNDYFDNLVIGSPNYFKFFPIAFWWRLTTIIPLRPFEFAGIKRDGLYTSNGKYYIKVPRSDKKGGGNKNNIQIIKDIAISKEMNGFLKTYIESTEVFGDTQTLISYKSIQQTYVEQNGRQVGKKLNSQYFTYSILYRLLESFYSEIILGEYGISYNPKRETSIQQKNINKKHRDLLTKVLSDVDENYTIQRKVSLGDTRHFAMLNLQRLGYHPVEMARLAGHVNLNTQYSYHSHQLNWIDTEILKLMSTFKFGKKENSFIPTNGFVGWELKSEFETSKSWREKFVLPLESLTSPSTVMKKLELGYCTDDKQRCPVNDCAEGCDFWRIGIDEYNEKRRIIESKVAVAQGRLKYLVLSLVELHKYAISENGSADVAEDNLNFNQVLIRKSIEIDEMLHKLVELSTINKRKVIEF